MKKLILFAIALLLAIPSFAQDFQDDNAPAAEVSADVKQMQELFTKCVDKYKKKAWGLKHVDGTIPFNKNSTELILVDINWDYATDVESLSNAINTEDKPSDSKSTDDPGDFGSFFSTYNKTIVSSFNSANNGGLQLTTDKNAGAKYKLKVYPINYTFTSVKKGIFGSSTMLMIMGMIYLQDANTDTNLATFYSQEFFLWSATAGNAAASAGSQQKVWTSVAEKTTDSLTKTFKKGK